MILLAAMTRSMVLDLGGQKCICTCGQKLSFAIIYFIFFVFVWIILDCWFTFIVLVSDCFPVWYLTLGLFLWLREQVTLGPYYKLLSFFMFQFLTLISNSVKVLLINVIIIFKIDVKAHNGLLLCLFFNLHTLLVFFSFLSSFLVPLQSSFSFLPTHNISPQLSQKKKAKKEKDRNVLLDERSLGEWMKSHTVYLCLMIVKPLFYFLLSNKEYK